jgi:hypothetical protein
MVKQNFISAHLNRRLLTIVVGLDVVYLVYGYRDLI